MANLVLACYLKLSDEDYKEAKSIDDFFIILRRHMSYFNHEILGKIIKEFGDHHMNKRHKCFCTDLKTFFQRCILETPLNINSTEQRGRLLFLSTKLIT